MVDDYSFTVDLNKPIVSQVGHLGEAYYEWVHQPIVNKEGPRFFANDFCELLTRTAWWVVPVVWLPVASWFISMSSRMGLADHPDQLVLTVVGGIFIWTLEGNTIHYAMHGYHHKYRMDAMRLVMPPPAAAVLSVPFWLLFSVLSPPSVAPALFGGSVLGYIAYDLTHYYLHHGKPSKKSTQKFKRYHLNHHFRIQSKGFGVTSSFWDNVFGTVPSTKAAEKNQN